MNQKLYADTQKIVRAAIDAVQPDHAVKRALTQINPRWTENAEALPAGIERPSEKAGNIYLVAIGKAAWKMASVASQILGEKITQGIVITKYGHVQGEIPTVRCFEAGHPVPDQNSFDATEQVMQMTSQLREEDQVLLLISGGGSALFEKPLCSAEELESVTRQLLASGADIVEINTIRKRLSAVKGGKFAVLCKPAQVYAIILSDIIGDPIDMIASGPAYPDSSDCGQALHIIKKYDIQISADAEKLLQIETPKALDNVTTIVTGSVKELCNAAAKACEALGYRPVVLTTELCCQAREAGSFLGSIGSYYNDKHEKIAFIAGGETVVKLTGDGLGGRNQEIALAAAAEISGKRNLAVFSIGSDGTDGPTDAAGGYVDGDSACALQQQGISIADVLRRNDAYHGLAACDGLLITGPTGTNVNDVSVVLIDFEAGKQE